MPPRPLGESARTKRLCHYIEYKYVKARVDMLANSFNTLHAPRCEFIQTLANFTVLTIQTEWTLEPLGNCCIKLSFNHFQMCRLSAVQLFFNIVLVLYFFLWRLSR